MKRMKIASKSRDSLSIGVHSSIYGLVQKLISVFWTVLRDVKRLAAIFGEAETYALSRLTQLLAEKLDLQIDIFPWTDCNETVSVSDDLVVNKLE